MCVEKNEPQRAQHTHGLEQCRLVAQTGVQHDAIASLADRHTWKLGGYLRDRVTLTTIS